MQSSYPIIAVTILCLLTMTSATADDPAATEADWAYLPTWCRYATTPVASRTDEAIVKDPAVRAKLHSLATAGCGGFHHYCWALIWINRGMSNQDADNATARAQYESAMADFGYVFRTGAPGGKCPLYPDMHTKMGELNILRGKPKEAEESFLKALAVTPGYAPAYIGLSDLYESQEQGAKALEALQAGIQKNPNSTALKKKLARLQARSTAQPSTP